MSVKVSDNEIKELAWTYIKDGDLDSLTRKKLRDYIQSSVSSDHLQRDDDELKRLVKNLVPELLERREKIESNAGVECAETPVNQKFTGKRFSPTSLQEKVGAPAQSEERIARGAEIESGKSGRELSKSRDEAKPESAQDSATGKVGAKKRRITESNGTGSGEDASSSEDTEEVRRVKSSKKRAVPASKRGKVDKRLSKMLRVARQLGCQIPPRVLRCDDGEKIDACREYLRSKGVEGDVLQMNSVGISDLRQRLDREKEIDALDTDNIITSGTRSRRRTVLTNVSRPDPDEVKRREPESDSQGGEGILTDSPDEEEGSLSEFVVSEDDSS